MRCPPLACRVRNQVILCSHAPQTSHGAPALMDAIRALLRAALAVPHNQQFLLLSESEVRPSCRRTS